MATRARARARGPDTALQAGPRFPTASATRPGDWALGLSVGAQHLGAHACRLLREGTGALVQDLPDSKLHLQLPQLACGPPLG